MRRIPPPSAGRVSRVSATGGGSLVQHVANSGHDTLNLAFDFVVPEAQHLKASLHEMLVTMPVFRIALMVRPVYFYDQPVGEFGEVENPAIKRNLTAKMIP